MRSATKARTKGTIEPPNFQEFFEATPGLYLILDPELHIVAANDAYCRATMTMREAILGRSVFEVFPDNPADPTPQGVRRLRDSLEHVLTYRRPDAMGVQKYDIRRPESEGGDFEERYWNPVNCPVLGADGEVRWIFNHVEDVTALMRMKAQGEERDQLAAKQERMIEQLRAANAELAHQTEEKARLAEILKRTVESMADPVVVADGQGRIVLTNPAAAYLFDSPLTLQDLTRAHRLFPPDGLAALPNDEGPLSRAILGEATNHLEFIRRPLAAGKDRHFIASGRPIRNEAGAVERAVAVYHDITEMRATERQLRQAQKMEAIGQLTGGIAHDFNNVLTVIIGMTSVLAEAVSDDPRLVESTGMIAEAAERAAQMIQNLMAFARKQPLQPRATDINALVVAAGKLLRPTLGEQVEITVRPENEVWPALVDEPQLTNAILNLAINARDAMPGGGKLTIETKNVILDDAYAQTNNEVQPGAYVMIALSDTGIGIPAANLERIFEPFFTTKKLNSGTGLGLSMVYGFVKQSGGHIKVYSEEGHGTTIKLYLPRATEDTGQQPAEIFEAGLAGGSETILVVEDDALVRSYVTAQLKSLGYAIREVANAADALALVRSGTSFDLLFTDIILPGGMNGRQLADEVIKLRPSARVLYTSGYTENAMIHHGRLESGGLLLAKPYRKADLARTLRLALSS